MREKGDQWSLTKSHSDLCQGIWTNNASPPFFTYCTWWNHSKHCMFILYCHWLQQITEAESSRHKKKLKGKGWYYSIFFILLTNPIKRPKQDYHPSPLVPTLDTNFHKYKRVLQPKRPAGVFPKLAEWLPNIYKGWKLPATGLPDLRRRGNNNRPLVNVKNRSQFG